MALADNIALRTQAVTLQVRVNGVLLVASDPTSATGTPGVGGVKISKSFSSPVPVCTIEMNRVPTWIRRGQTVTVDAGYNGLVQRVFTGFVQSRNKRVGAGGINCMGKLWAAFRTVEIEERSVDGMTVQAAIESILTDVGITDRALTIPAFTLGTASSPRLERMAASQMLQMLMDIDGCRVYELGSGQVIIRVLEEIPAATSFRSFSTDTAATQRIIDASDSEDPEYFRDYISVVGATVVEGTAPDQTSRTITANAPLLGSDLVQPPLPAGRQIQAEYNNHLVDTDAKASAIAVRLLTRYARIPKQLVATVVGDPQLELGQTITMTIPEMDIDSPFFVSSIEHSISRSGFVTTLRDLRGGDELGGTIAVNPIAAFIFHTEREIFGNALNVVATLNASASFDPDGSIVSYAWSDNQTTTPEIATLTTAVVTVRADTSAWSGNWDVTLTVTDNDGLTHAVTITIPYTNDTVDTIPAVYAALETHASATLDGGTNWNDESGSTCISTGARPSDGVNTGHALYGFSDGHIARTIDGAVNLTTVMAAIGSPINCVAWDWRNTNVCWALASDMRLYISVDAGVTWVIYAALRTTLGLAGAIAGRRAIGLPAAGGIYVFGGTGAGTPLIAYDSVVGANAWVQQIMTGDPVSDFPADATCRIVDYTAPGNGIEVMILEYASGGGASIQPIYATGDPPGTSRGWTRATGLTAGLKTGRYVLGDDPRAAMKFHAAFGDRDIWDSANGVAWTEKNDVMPAGLTPNDALFMSDVLTGIPDMAGVYLVAAQNAGGTLGIYKSSDGLTTVSVFRPSTLGTAWTAGMKGRYLSVGAPGLASTGFDLYAQMDGSDEELLRCQGAAWEEKSTDAGNENWHLKNLNGVLYRIADKVATVGDVAGPGSLERSTDNGATWTVEIASSGVYGVQSVTIGADGALWALWGSIGDTTTSLIVKKSVDNGLNWTDEYTDAGTGASALFPIDIACSPTDASRIAVTCIRNSGGNRVVVTTDGWATSNIRTITVTTSGTNGLWLVWGDSARLVVAGGGTLIQTSDDLGVTWTSRDNPAGTASSFIVRFGTRILYGLSDASSNGGSVRISLDNGTTWAVYVTGNSINASLTTGVAPYGICIDQSNGLCLTFSAVTLTDAWWRNPDPWAATLPAWESIAFNGDAVATGSMSIQGLAGAADTQ